MNTWGTLACGSMNLGAGFMAMVFTWLAACILFFVNFILIAFQPSSAKFSHLLLAGAYGAGVLLLVANAAANDPWISMLVSLAAYALPFIIIGHFVVLLVSIIKRTKARRTSAEVSASIQLPA